MKRIITYVFFLLAGTFLSCQETDEFKVSSDVGFRMDIDREANSNERLNFTGGYITLASFSFEGRREQGADVFFTKEYDRGLQIAFDATQPVDALAFQVPQGNYVRIEVEMETYDGTSISGLVVTGSYLHSNGTRYPLRLELSSSVDFEIEAKDKTGSKQIVLKQSSPASAKIKLDPAEWFEAVPLSHMDSAVLATGENEGERESEEEGESEEEMESGASFILINEEFNESIYEIIITRIEQSAEIVFE